MYIGVMRISRNISPVFATSECVVKHFIAPLDDDDEIRIMV